MFKMRKYIFLYVLLLSLTSLEAKTTFIPHYRSYISLTTDKGEKIEEERTTLTHIVNDPEGRFILSVIHEEMTIDKVKRIKRKANQAKWMSASALLYSVSTLGSGSLASFNARLANARISKMMAGMYAHNAKAEQVLGVEIQVTNTYNREMMVADIERGLVWYVMPGHSCTLQLSNPDAALLRISDAEFTTKSICYATLSGGSSVTQEEILYEDDNCFVVRHYDDNDELYAPITPTELFYIDKDDFTENPYSSKQLKELKSK